jgi:hypothetical protein
MHYAKNTKNNSFIAMWHLLQRNNIENNIFMLQVNDPALADFSYEDLINADPDDPMTNVLRTQVINECKQNIWFYFREVATIPLYDDKSGKQAYFRFPLTEKTMAMIYLFQAGASFICKHLDDTTKYTYELLWNYYHSTKGTDFQISNSSKSDIKDAVLKAQIVASNRIVWGSSLAVSLPENRFICNDDRSLESRLRQYGGNPLQQDIEKAYKAFIPVNSKQKSGALFDLTHNTTPLMYTLLFHMLPDKINWDYYFLGFESQSIEWTILQSWMKDFIDEFKIDDYSKKSLNKVYFI